MTDKISDDALAEVNKDRKWLDENIGIYRGVTRLRKGVKHMDGATRCDKCKKKVILGKWAIHQSKECQFRKKQSVLDALNDTPKTVLKAYGLPVDVDLYDPYMAVTRLLRRQSILDQRNDLSELVDCPCGAKFIMGTDQAHIRSRKHQKHLKDKQTIQEYLEFLKSKEDQMNTKKETIDESNDKAIESITLD